MRKVLFICLALAIQIICFAQKDKSKVAVLLALSGDSYVENKEGKIKLSVPYFFQNNDLITINSGSIEILQSNGEELKLNKGQSYKVDKSKDIEVIELDDFYISLSKEKNFSQSQSNSAVTVRGEKADMVLFPISSKLANKEHAFITCDLKTTKKVKVELEILNMQSDALVYRNTYTSVTEIALTEIPLKQGQDYIWTIKADGKETDQIGLITYIDNKKQESLMQFELTKKVDYIKAHQYYVDNEFWFAAKRTVKMGAEKYPETDLFEYLLSVMVK